MLRISSIQRLPGAGLASCALVLAPAAVAINACTLVIDDAREQCSVTADCRARGEAFVASECQAGRCVEVADESTNEPQTCDVSADCVAGMRCKSELCLDPFACEPPPETSGELAIALPVVDVMGKPLSGVSARVCWNMDPECLNPLQEARVGDDGALKLRLEAGFRGYVEFHAEGFVPQIHALPVRFPVDGQLPPVRLLPEDLIYGGLTAAIGTEPDPEKGHLFLTLLDCLGLAEDVEISSTGVDGASVRFYSLDGIPSSDLSKTTTSGVAGFVNFPPGNTVVSFASASTGGSLGQVGLVVRKGAVTTGTPQLLLQ